MRTGDVHMHQGMKSVGTATLLLMMVVMGGAESNVGDDVRRGDGCNVTDPFSPLNASIDLSYLAGFGNVSLGNGDSATVSFCTPANVSAADGASCGPVYLARVGATCDASLLFDVVAAPLTVVDNRTAQLNLSSTRGAYTAEVLLVCRVGLDFASDASPTRQGEAYTFVFHGEQLCAGYLPPPQEEETMLSKGAIVGIIIGIVAFVVVAAALFQWRSRSAGGEEDGYTQI